MAQQHYNDPTSGPYQKYEIVLDSNTNNILFEVDSSNNTIINTVSLLEPKFFSVGLLSDKFYVDNNGNVRIHGDLTVSGQYSQFKSEISVFNDRVIELGRDASNSSFTNDYDAGFIFNRGTNNNNVCMIWDESSNSFTFGETTKNATDIVNRNQLNVDPTKYVEFMSTESKFNNKLSILSDNSPVATRLQVGSSLTYNTDNNYSYDTNAVSFIHPTLTSNSILNDPKDILYLLRKGTDTVTYSQKASFSLSKYEYDSLNSRTRLDLNLAHDSFDDANVMTFLSSKNVGINNANPKHSLDINGDFSIGIDDSIKFKYILQMESIFQ